MTDDPNAKGVDSRDPPPPPPPPNSRPHTTDVDTGAGTSTATGGGIDALGQQVHPSTQTNEADGNRTLANPVVDPGPSGIPGRINVQHPDRKQGQHRYGEANDPIPVLMRTSTGHDLGFARPSGNTHTIEDMPPDLAINGAASECYHPSDGKETSLTADAESKALEQRQPAPMRP